MVLGDMATATAPGEFRLVYLVFNTIANLLTQEEQVACFRNAARHLVPGGRFLIELWVPELRKLPPGVGATVWLNEPGYVGLDTYDVLHQRVVSHHFRFDEGRQADHAGRRTGTSGQPSSTSWRSWPGSPSRAATPTGPAGSSPPTRVRTCRCTGVAEAHRVDV